MNIASTPFLFYFLPAAIGIYYLIPAGKGLKLRNLFLLAASIFFYAWGEPVHILLLLAQILLVRLFGKMAERGRARALGKWAVALTVAVSIGTLLSFKHLGTDFPVGMSFFCFHAISYVVDIYRGQCSSPKSISSTALYLAVFYKMLIGPIVTFREFEPQIEHRKSSWDDICDGLWRFAIGFGKKMIISGNLQILVNNVFAADLSTVTVADAWIGCVVFMVYMYFDFSGYSDMAIGLGRIFGFKTPENFNYPYISTSIAEYWRRWHITLIAWFRDYLYYPILLGPSVRFRKWLLRHNVDTGLAKTMQNIFVPACVWIVTAMWHGTNWNYTIWGIVNCAIIVAEPYLKPFGGRRKNVALRWLGTILLLLMMVPLIGTDNLGSAGSLLSTMFGHGAALGVSPLMLRLMKMNGIFLAIGLIGCFPVRTRFRGKVRDVAEFALAVAAVIFSLAYLFDGGNVWFMYQ